MACAGPGPGPGAAAPSVYRADSRCGGKNYARTTRSGTAATATAARCQAEVVAECEGKGEGEGGQGLTPQYLPATVHTAADPVFIAPEYSIIVTLS